ncbi:Histidine kinase osmosensor [Vermiconidia calcicola]|uniref:Histidine kinase osmosensor n=1 Tax=Vermiconidia calcicola TaxID=1690605 RepID=A0ACC3N5U4_9PEZI|nr:Histidine kinase osmosensor [Vermiconidia calcicola]
MRIPIREQLAGLILLASLIALGVISIATWVSNHQFVISIVKARLSVRASLKANQVDSNLNLMQITASFVSTRIVIQAALERYNNDGDNSDGNWDEAQVDMSAALAGTGGEALLLQTVIFPRNASGPAGRAGILNTTSPASFMNVRLPYLCPDGTPALLGMNASDCGDLGYPPALYPNLTYTSYTLGSGVEVQQATYDGTVIGPGAKSGLLLGPWVVNNTLSLVSITMPVLSNTSTLDVLGWLTVLMDARLIRQVVESSEGLDRTGETLLVGPDSASNLFRGGILYDANGGDPPQEFMVRYVTELNSSWSSRHPNRTIASANAPFSATQYPAIMAALTQKTGEADNSGSMIKGHNEGSKKVATGYAMLENDMVDWLVLIEQARSEVFAPIHNLRDILLACVFGTMGFMAIIAFPLAHFASAPIRRLRAATMKTVEPPGMTPSRSSIGSFESVIERQGSGSGEIETADGAVVAEKDGSKNHRVGRWREKRQHDREARHERQRRREFRIPGKVKERKVFVKDDLSDLTKTFNEMSDELMMQYSRLEERVQQRTAELELSKKAAETANESKTLFIANISHELKTPLNGILGMCAVCMSEEDPIRLKRSLGIIYKSGDLLLNLLTDLLTFSKNQVGQHLSLDEKEFRLRDVSSQILAIFDKQARDGQIDLRVEWEGVQNLPADKSSPERTDFGPNGMGRLKDMILWGDVQRILQVAINLVSNSLKFTPSGGSVVLTIRCLSEPYESASRKISSASRRSGQSRQSRHLSSRNRASDSASKVDTISAIHARDMPSGLANVYGRDRAASPPPGTYLLFEFEVTDTGPGIPDSLQDKIFQPFVQGDLGLSRKYGGTGLGLSICSQLATLMRGTVGVRSTVGVGSTFTMKIPLRHLKTRADSSASSTVDLHNARPELRKTGSSDDGEWAPARHSRHLADDGNEEKASPSSGHASAPALTTESQPRLVGLSQPFFTTSSPMESPSSQPAAMEKMAAEASRSGGKIRVLVAEDNKINQEVVLRMLKLEDIYDVTVAKDGQEALDFVKESMNHGGLDSTGEERKPFNLIFMDVQMPNVDGLQSTRLIREIGYEAPIVALTAFAEESNIKDCLDSGMNYFLSKPIRRPQLKKVLKEYCAPIPEENEETTPPGAESRPPMQETTIVMVNGPGTQGDVPSQQSEQPKGDGWQQPGSSRRVEEIKRPASPVSPFTNA